jgi:3D-(3,5/4)-trihydroxycyclohexane-1,2-dione acylhydrolase (decyclizing)
MIKNTDLKQNAQKSIRIRAEKIRNKFKRNGAVKFTDSKVIELTLSEALLLGLLKQGVKRFFVIFGHGSTDFGEVLRIYNEEGVIDVINCRNEIEMAHAATAYAWVYKDTPAVVTSIGPGALQAMAGSLTAVSNNIGVYHIYGDETTHGEGYNMQQIPKPEQGVFGKITSLMNQSYTLHTPESLRECLRRGLSCVGHPYKPGPFYIMLPINTQPQNMKVNMSTLPERLETPKVSVSQAKYFKEAVKIIQTSHKLIIKAGGGTRNHFKAVRKLSDLISAPVVLSPGSTGVLRDNHQNNMHVGGSKGSISGNFAMENADTVIMIGSRGVCQADCSGIGYPKASKIININGDLDDLNHYANTIGLPGDISEVIEKLIRKLGKNTISRKRTEWLKVCQKKKDQWTKFKAKRIKVNAIKDPVWKRNTLTQPVAVHTVAAFAKIKGAIKFFDAGDVQANGFQLVEDDEPNSTFTDSGASYMGFASSALLASAYLDRPKYAIAFTGDGSFMMNPQILIDAVEHKVKGMIAIFDNRRMAAITGLQEAQYNKEFKTNDSVVVDYVALANAVTGIRAFHGGFTPKSLNDALSKAYDYRGLSLVHIPVYAGSDELGGMGAYGSWNVGNWVGEVQGKYLQMKV